MRGEKLGRTSRTNFHGLCIIRVAERLATIRRHSRVDSRQRAPAAADHSILPAIRPDTSLAVLIRSIDMNPKRKPACPPCRWLVIFLAVLLVSSISRAATIEGNISTKRGTPINRVTVTMSAQGGGGHAAFAQSVVTGEDGNFSFLGVHPGSHLVSIRKHGWVYARRYVVVSEEATSDRIEADFVMELTLLYQVLANIQLSGLVYVLLFGMIVLAMNFSVAPEPSRGVTGVAWSIVLGTIAIACVKRDLNQAVLFAVLGISVGVLIHRIGSKTAARRLRQQEEEMRNELAARNRATEALMALVGKEGVTLTDLKACGSVEIDGQIVQVRALRGFIPLDTRVVVRVIDGKAPVVQAP